MKRFINRERELATLNEQYAADDASFMVIYGRRRVGKTTLIKEFLKDKKAFYFLAEEENEAISMKRFANLLAGYTGQDYIKKMQFDDWHEIFELFKDYKSEEKKILIIDELPYMVNANAAFPSILQWVWDEWFQHQNIMLILCGSLINMMEKHTLNYNSPLYGRRSGQIKLKQIDFMHYNKFYDDMPYRDLIEHYAVTGGVPKYIELFDKKKTLFNEISRLILSPDGLLFEEPEFLLRREVEEIGSYFSIIKSIAAGNHKPGKISSDIEIKQTSLPKYLKTLMDLDILEREVPVTENNPEKSKMSLYQIKDNFLRFWFRFVYPERGRLEMGQSGYVLERIKANFIDNHVAHIYETVCRSELWRLAIAGEVQFNKLGHWWNSKAEIDIVALDSTGNDIVFAECKYRNQLMDTDVFYNLLEKKELVPWNKGRRKEKFVLFSISGFTEQLLDLAKTRNDLLLFGGDGELIG
ncbi:MAG: ATP-binding protein [Oscillospiraceae bacterium]|nr:ATP-binding protein [Oscillospiraceae bacterium]